MDLGYGSESVMGRLTEQLHGRMSKHVRSMVGNGVKEWWVADVDLVANRTNVPIHPGIVMKRNAPGLMLIAQLDVVGAVQSDVPQSPICKVVVVHVVSMGPQ